MVNWGLRYFTDFVCMQEKRKKGALYRFLRCVKDGGDGHRLYARKNFETGEAITFISKEEEKNEGMLGLGGSAARISDDRRYCNAYLTKHGALRSIADIKEGDEIVRWNACTLDYFERIDRLVVSPLGDRVGRIHPYAGDGCIWVYYGDGTREAMKEDTKFGYVYREKIV